MILVDSLYPSTEIKLLVPYFQYLRQTHMRQKKNQVKEFRIMCIIFHLLLH